MESKIKYLINNIFDNFDFEKGSFKASPSNEPNYNYHWVRDSCLIVNIMIDAYTRGFIEPKKFISFIENFLAFERKTNNISIMSGLGEPKYNLDGTPYMEDWGRPQNDGPALRCMVYLKLMNVLPYYNKVLKKLLEKNIDYIKKNIYQKNFDLWEEVSGYHFYTSYLQLIVLLQTDKQYNNTTAIKHLQDLLDRFQKDDHIISSIETGHNRKFLDASVLMSFLHSDTHPEHWLPRCNKLISMLKKEFNTIYPFNNYSKTDWFGRYPEDVYYGGNPWVICTMAKLTFEYKYKLKSKLYILDHFNHVWNHMDLVKDQPEQIDRADGSSKSARYLTWNSVELLRFIFTFLEC